MRESLGSLSCRTCMIAHVSPSMQAYNETLQVTQLAAKIHRMKRRKTKVPSATATVKKLIITARVRSTTGRYCFHRCLSVHGGGVPISHNALQHFPECHGAAGGYLTGYPPRGGVYLTGYPPGGGPDWVPPRGGVYLTGYPPPGGCVPDWVPPPGGVPDWVPPRGGVYLTGYPPGGCVPDRVPPPGGYLTGSPPGGYLTGSPPGGVVPDRVPPPGGYLTGYPPGGDLTGYPPGGT